MLHSSMPAVVRGWESFASHSLKTSRWLQLGLEEGQVEQWYPVIPHTLVYFMSPWFVPSYIPTRNGSVDSISTFGLVPHDKSHQEIEESKHGCSRVIVKHRSQSGKHWSSNLRNGLVVNVLNFPTHGSYTVAQ